MSMKYINFENAGIVVFPSHNNHKDIAEKFKNDKVISAGFVSMHIEDKNDVCTHGESFTLNVSSNKSDSNYLFRMLSLYM